MPCCTAGKSSTASIAEDITDLLCTDSTLSLKIAYVHTQNSCNECNAKKEGKK